MIRGTRLRIAAFLVLSAVGIVYITASYLGFVDRVLGRGLTVHATLPTSGGLYEGSEVTYRGVKIGKVSHMNATPDGVTLDLALEEGTELPKDAPMYVHNLSAVGEQYLDFEPADEKPPYAEDGDTLHGNAKSLPVDEGDLLVELNAFVGSVDKEKLRTLVRELGTMFHDTGKPLQQLLDNGSTFIGEASAHTAETRALLDDGLTVLQTQEGEGENIRAFSHDLARITRSLKDSDADLRTTLAETPRDRARGRPAAHRAGADTAGAAGERDQRRPGRDAAPRRARAAPGGLPARDLQRLHRHARRRLRPRQPAAGPGGPAVHAGLQAPDQWRPPSDLSDGPIFPAQCTAGEPFVQRGTPYSPDGRVGSPGAAYRGGYDPTSGIIDGVVDANGNPVHLGDQGNLSVLGDDSWKWLLVGPVVATP